MSWAITIQLSDSDMEELFEDDGKEVNAGICLESKRHIALEIASKLNVRTNQVHLHKHCERCGN